MKKIITLVLALTLCMALCACGGDKPAETPASTAAPVVTEAPVEATAAPTEEPAPTAEPVVESNDKEVAMSLIDAPIEDLYAAIGEPATPGEYASSCLIDGEDGVLYYDGFTVYTLRYADGTETVYHVE